MTPEQLEEIKQSAELCTLTRDEIIAISNLAFAVLRSKQNVGLRMIDFADSARKIIEQKRPGKDCIANLLAHVEEQDRRLKELTDTGHPVRPHFDEGLFEQMIGSFPKQLTGDKDAAEALDEFRS